MVKCCDNKEHSNDHRLLLKEAGFSATKTKLKILEVFASSQSPLSSAELISLISDVDESTIFRNLKQFSKAGILDEVNLKEGFNRYELSPSDHHHHHIKCNICDKIDTIDLCELKAFAKQFKKLGYKDISHKFEFFGTCSACS